VTAPVKVVGFLGDGGRLFSPGWIDFLNGLEGERYSVTLAKDSGRDAEGWADYVAGLDNPHVALLGYSLGAWGVARVARRLDETRPQVRIALAAGLDPPSGRLSGIVAGYPRPREWFIGRNVSRCICIYNDLPWSPVSWLYGGGRYVIGGCPVSEFYPTAQDHFLIQFSGKHRQTIRDALDVVV
jgi:pimeloyl-ACP methyl ester carboxylesterase